MKLARLKVLAGLGWGSHPDVLRVRSASLLRGFRHMATFIIVVIPIGTVIAIAVGQGRLRWPPSPATMRMAALYASLYLALLVVGVLVPGITSWWLARRGAQVGTSTFYGRCFAVLLDPPGFFFARIGLTPQSARWYSLPLDWDGVVVPSDAQLELTVLEGTGWVERLRRLGPFPRELSQPVPPPPTRIESAGSGTLDGDGAASITGNAPADDINEGATKEEKAALRRFARRANLGWRAPPRMLANWGWALMVSGALPPLFPLGLIAYLAFGTPQLWAQSLKEPGFVPPLIFVVVFFGTLSLVSIGYGVYCLRGWRRFRRFSQESPATAEGEVLAWMPYRDGWTPPDGQQRKETLISLRTPEGQSRVFRIPIRYLHRVRQRGAQVKITYLPGTERVLDVVRAETPVEAIVEGSPSH